MNIEVNCEYREDLIATVPVSDLATFVLAHEACPKNAEVSISFIDDDEMARLNEEYRGKTGPTDVLSFECDGLDDEMGEGRNAFPDMPFELGDVIIALDVAERQTARFGTTFEGEMSVLLVHGLLHLCGYDHIEDDEAEVMEAREAEILRGWAQERGVDLSIFGEFNGPGALVRGEH
ncbi:rRNA maturation RNase YbeY [uncultured Ellagibacter sp.]|uniref:rRNA maturation RNase YbeY n=1 Tax=uncultured Ellagibacter sp. TaxID=2137580 RepID=UPI002624BA29|nr:rRNA maturation RNase YbeY [uncultured Ellagibacter sp.]